MDLKIDLPKDNGGCQNCKHWHRTGLQQGDCRSHPPTVGFAIGQQGIAKITAYPERKPTDPTCGEMVRRFAVAE